jgi:hypothetical protein
MPHQIRFLTSSACAAASVLALALAATSPAAIAQDAAPADASKPGSRILSVMQPEQADPDAVDALKWPVPKGLERYGRIDGVHLKAMVEAQAQISRDYRDKGHQYWGRIMGTEADAVGAAWMEAEFRRIGLTGIRMQSFDVPETIMPKSWSVTVGSGPTSLAIPSALPIGRIPAETTTAKALDLVYVGLGGPVDFGDRAVNGKAVLIHAIPEPSAFFSSASLNGAVERAERLGAAAVFITLGLPGNITGHMSLRCEKVPCFVIGKEDSERILGEIDRAGGKVSLSYRLETERRIDLKTTQVWGVLEGATDENIMIIAHRDGYYEAALDNGSGVATMLGLAEYFAAVPKKDRKRTLIFVGTPGHHDPNFLGTTWMHDNREQVFGKTAVLINAEHTAYTEAEDILGKLRKSNSLPAFNWYVGGSPLLRDISVKAFTDFGVPLLAQPDRTAPGEVGKIRDDAPMVQIITAAWPYHSSRDDAAIIPAAGIEASTRAYARIIDEVNKLPAKALAAPANTTP